ncbi:unnamed protein product [Acanthoscelides obtectus]|uniref:Uncharacterized protein n=1 Tax=Acanthoscelides obtectus TaxID=200917 RepID=A0A9P0QBL5_ACAOB|nr:unnamed protein product [Acanthoscelides obtectus]CAK1684120.1 hypothetical protein AOBTE_LOCUS34639 [Acanthoscelides obtectus]
MRVITSSLNSIQSSLKQVKNDVKPSNIKIMKNILVIKKTDDAVRPLSPQPDPSKASTSVQEESEETRPSTTSELDSTPDSDNSVSMSSEGIPTLFGSIRAPALSSALHGSLVMSAESV